MINLAMTRGARYAVVFLFALTLAIGAANLLFTSHLVNRVTVAKASVVQLCQLGNESRAQQVQLWEFVIQISHSPPHESAAHKAQRERTIRQFVAHLHKVFAPRDCQRRLAR